MVLRLTGAAMAKKAKKKCSSPRCWNDAAVELLLSLYGYLAALLLFSLRCMNGCMAFPGVMSANAWEWPA